ncbi:MAG: hypothetical protein AB7K52_10925 [Phycisphaerales bacterium]
MTALPVSASVRPSAVQPHGFSAFLSAFRKVAAKVNEVEPKRATTARGQAAAQANSLMREHASVCPTL